ncbi:MAG: hypothetical protein KAI82_07965, partial [Tritonibacter mobilis]|nr:hypothetical protein [Tritonibacter mobilis]
AQPVQERCCWLGFWKRDLFTVKMKGNRHLEKPVAVPCCPMLRDFRCDVESARALFDVTLSLCGLANQSKNNGCRHRLIFLHV